MDDQNVEKAEDHGESSNYDRPSDKDELESPNEGILYKEIQKDEKTDADGDGGGYTSLYKHRKSPRLTLVRSAWQGPVARLPQRPGAS